MLDLIHNIVSRMKIITTGLRLPAPGVMFRDMAGAAPFTIPVTDGHAFEDRTMGIYKVAIYCFANWPCDGVVLTPVQPSAIGAIYE